MKWWQNNDNDYNDLNLTIKILKTRWNHKKAKKLKTIIIVELKLNKEIQNTVMTQNDTKC